MNEASYTYYLKKNYQKKHHGCFWFKIPDCFAAEKKEFYGLDQVKRPFDVLTIHQDTGFRAIEVKLHKSLSPFSFKRVAPHQIQSLRSVIKNGGSGFLVIGVRASLKDYDRKQLGVSFSKFAMDIWIDANEVPGFGDWIDASSIKLREIASGISESEDLKGNKIYEVHLQQGRLVPYLR